MKNIDNNFIKLLNPIDAPLISIIIPTFNDSVHICKSIDSALAQEINNVEIIVIDDLSTDNTKQVLNSKYSNNNKVKLFFQKENKKQGYQRNFGIKKAKGKYIFFIDSDDWILKGTLIHLVSIAEKYNCEIVACGANTVYENGETTFFHGVDLKSNGGLQGLDLFAENKIGSIVWNKLYSRKLIINNKIFFDTKYWHEDVLFSLNAIYKCKNYISISKPYYNYLIRNDSNMRVKQDKHYLESYLNLYKEMCKFISKNITTNNVFEKDLKIRLLNSHCFINTFPNLLRYYSSRPGEEFRDDLIEVLNSESKLYGYGFAQFIYSSIASYYSVETKLQQTNNNFSITNTEQKIINGIRKIKHKIIPESSTRKIIFDKLKSF